MTTPRVTVPPQALEAIAFNLCSLHDFDVRFVQENERFAAAVITEYVRTLSAAPAPEGVVVWFGVTGAADETEALAVALFDARCPGIRMTDEDLHYYRSAAKRAMQAVTDELDTPALATREEAPAPCKSCNGSGMDAGSRFNRCPDCCGEAPAEAGEDEWSALWKLADAASTGSWGVEDPMDHCLTIVANPEAPVYNWKWIATCDWPDEDNQLVTAREVKANAAFIAAANPAAIKRLIVALRAQPPARDSLRVREDVAREIKAWADTRWPKSHRVGSKGWVNGLTNRVIAALQAEQKGGA